MPAVPFINIFANSVGGIGPIEAVDLPYLQELSGQTGINYVGRFYPKGSDSKLRIFEPGYFSETPPWLIWEPIEETQIWMIQTGPDDEYILSTATSIERVDLWPRFEEVEDDPPPFNATPYDLRVWNTLWGHNKNLLTPEIVQTSIDPGIFIQQNVVPPLLFAGKLGISDVTGYFTEYAFYDQELSIINNPLYGQEHLNPDVSEMLRIRSDGVWRKQNFQIPGPGEPIQFSEDEQGNPAGFQHYIPYPPDSYAENAIVDPGKADTWGMDLWNQYTEWMGELEGSVPRAGLIPRYKYSELETVVFTIKTSCITIRKPDLEPISDGARDQLDFWAEYALNVLGDNILSNIWYFYCPVRFNGKYTGNRLTNLLNRAGVNRLGNENYRPTV